MTAADNYYGEYAVADTAMSFMEAEVQGIRTIYFNVDGCAPDYFAALTRNATFAQSLNTVRKLPRVVSSFIMEHG